MALEHTSQFSSCVKKTPMVNVDYIVSPFYNCPISFCKCCTVSWDKSKVKRMTSSSFKKSIWPYQIIKSIGSYIWQSVWGLTWFLWGSQLYVKLSFLKHIRPPLTSREHQKPLQQNVSCDLSLPPSPSPPLTLTAPAPPPPKKIFFSLTALSSSQSILKWKKISWF